MPITIPEQSFAPDVTVVIISYNDVANLGNAIRSAQNQTLRNLEIIISDDHSSDSTPDLVREFMSVDSRVRYHRLAENSGGCGAPRNEARLLATGRYIMFLDSDDTLERHACKNLLLEAERTGADLVSGKIQRVYLGEDHRTTVWYPRLYDKRHHFNSIEDFPVFIHDTAVTNKLYRREFLEKNALSFLEDIHYEDMIYSAQCLARARGISIIPELVYNWNVYPSETRVSITNQRDQLKNLVDRLYSVGLAYDELRSRAPKVLEEFELKLLRHHLRLYLNDMLTMDHSWSIQVLEKIRPWVASVERGVFDLLEPAERFLYASVLESDVEAIRALIPAAWARTFSGNIYKHGDSQYWAPRGKTSRPSTSELASQLSSTTDITIHRLPHAKTHYLHSARFMLARDGIVLTGTTTDPFFDLIDSVRSVTLVEQPHPSERFPVSTGTFSHNGEQLEWELPFPPLKRRSLRERTGKNFFVELQLLDGSVNSSPLVLIDHDETIKFRDASILGKFLGDRWEITSSPGRPVVFELELSKRGAVAREALRRVKPFFKKSGSAFGTLSNTLSPRSSFAHRVVYPMMRCLPVRKNLYLFETNMGTSAFDNPRAIFDQMLKQNEQFHAVWSHNGSPSVISDLPATKQVRRGTYAYLLALSRASHIVENQSLPRYYVKRKSQRYLQTWHGIPYKRMGIDEPRFRSQEAHRYIRAQSEKWDALLAPSKFFEETLVPAFLYEGKVLRVGSPRLDGLVNNEYSAPAIRRALNVPSGNRIVLYAPTFRESSLNHGVNPLLVDLHQMREALGPDTTLLVRAHYLNRFSVPKDMTDFCRDVSGYGNVSELYEVGDLLITDYSSVMFDFAIMNKPIVIFAPDYNEYVRERGAYFNLRDNAPGEFIESESELYEYLGSPNAFAAHKEKLHLFKKKFVGKEDGTASSKAVDFLLGRYQ